MEWLVRQALARSKARTFLPDWWERLWHANRPKLPPLVGADVFILGEVCARYNLPHLLNRMPAYAWNAETAEMVEIYRAEWYARQGRAEQALRTANALRERDMRAFAIARLGRVHLQAGQPELAQQRFDSAHNLLKQGVSYHDPYFYIEALRILLEHTRLRESSQEVIHLVNRVPASHHDTLARQIGQIYLKHNSEKPLLTLAASAPPKLRSLLAPYVATAHIRQGEMARGVALANQVAEDIETPALELFLHALVQAGRADLAKPLWQREAEYYQAAAEADFVIWQRLPLQGHHPRGTVLTHSEPLWRFTQATCRTGWRDKAAALIRAVRVPEARTLMRLELAAAYYRAGDHAAAEQQIELATADFQQWRNPTLLVFAIGSLHEAGAQSFAAQFLQRAREHALRHPDPQLRAALLRHIAGAYARNRQLSEATQTALVQPDLNAQREALMFILRVATRDK